MGKTAIICLRKGENKGILVFDAFSLCPSKIKNSPDTYWDSLRFAYKKLQYGFIHILIQYANFWGQMLVLQYNW